jgi:hypothetical protein
LAYAFRLLLRVDPQRLRREPGESLERDLSQPGNNFASVL